MSNKNVIPLACRAPSVFYTVSIEHGPDGVRSIKIHDVEESDENQRRVAAALREAADMLAAAVAPAISESDLLALLPGTTYTDEPDGGSPSLLEQLQRMAKDAARYRRLRDKHHSDGPAAAVRCLTGPFFNAAIHGERLDAAIDAARDGGAV